jgi:hypothetical protein
VKLVGVGTGGEHHVHVLVVLEKMEHVGQITDVLLDHPSDDEQQILIGNLRYELRYYTAIFFHGNLYMLRKDVFEQLLLRHWADLLDKNALLQRVLTDARNADLRKTKTKDNLRPQTKLTITKFSVFDKFCFELWAEFVIPKDDNVVIGTHVYRLDLEGKLELAETIGMEFVVET